MNCPQCNKPVEFGAMFCDNCGTGVNCPQCGARAVFGQAFCDDCSGSLADLQSVPAAVQSGYGDPLPPTQSAYSSPYPSTEWLPHPSTEWLAPPPPNQSSPPKKTVIFSRRSDSHHRDKQNQVGPPAPTNVPPKTPKVPEFVIIRPLGQGGMSNTYLAHLENNKHKQIVIKMELVQDDSPPYLLNEAETLCKLDHPNIIKIYPLPDDETKFVGYLEDEERKYRYILLKYMPGGSLLDQLSRPMVPLANRSNGDPLSLPNIISIIEQIAKAIDYAHTEGVLHLDIKPSNILFSYTGKRAVISDFGIAQNMIKSRKGIPEPVIGTPIYMATERLDGEKLDKSADIYSMGVVLGEMLSIAIFHKTTTVTNFNKKFIFSEIQIDDLPKDLISIIRKATHDKPIQRYKTAAALLADLHRAQHKVVIKQNIARYVRLLRYLLYLRLPLVLISLFLLAVADVLYVLWFLSDVVYAWLNSVIYPLLAWLTNSPMITTVILGILNFVAFIVYESWDKNSGWSEDSDWSEDWSADPSTVQSVTPYPSQVGPVTQEQNWPTVVPDWPTTATVEPQSVPMPPQPVPMPPEFVPMPPEFVPMPQPAPMPPPPASIPLRPPSTIEESDYSPLALVAVHRGRKPSIKYELASQRTRIGRNPDNGIVLVEDPQISAKHAVIWQEKDEFILEDMGSRNGTSVNSERITKRTLQDGDLITVGGTILRFQYTTDYAALQNLNDGWADFGRAVEEDNQSGVEEPAKRISDLLARALDVPTPSYKFKLSWCHVFMLDTGVALADTRLPANLPLVYSTNKAPKGDDIEQLRQRFIHQTNETPPLFLLTLQLEKISEQHKRPLMTFARSSSFDLVLFSYTELREILLYRDSRRALRRIITNHVNLSVLSPFMVTGPTTEKMFFGREQELREITEKSATASFAIVGGRRIGKTSLLFRLHRQALPTAGFYTVYHDCSVTRTYEQFMNATIHDWQPKAPPNAATTFGELLQSPPDDKPLVMLLDEADKLVPADRNDSWRLFSQLRASANSGQVQFVLSGERTLREALHDSTSPLFNFVNEILLGPLDKKAVKELAIRPMAQLEIKMHDEAVIVERIYDFTSGHPNVIQRLCRRLLERLDKQSQRRITPEDVTTVTETPDFQRDDFLDTYWEAATLLEKLVSLLMVDDQNVRTLPTVQEALSEHCDLQPKAREVDNALQSLVDIRSILRRTPDGYQFAVEAFPRVVAGTMTLNDMLDILAEEYEEQNA